MGLPGRPIPGRWQSPVQRQSAFGALSRVLAISLFQWRARGQVLAHTKMGEMPIDAACRKRRPWVARACLWGGVGAMSHWGHIPSPEMVYRLLRQNPAHAQYADAPGEPAPELPSQSLRRVRLSAW